MPQLQLISTDVSYLTNTRDTILIQSPITITQQQKGDIGIHLKGLRTSDVKILVKSTPAPNIQVTRLQWTMNGAILYIDFSKDIVITAGQHIGILQWQPFEQQTAVQDTTYTVSFQIGIG